MIQTKLKSLACACRRYSRPATIDFVAYVTITCRFGKLRKDTACLTRGALTRSFLRSLPVLRQTRGHKRVAKTVHITRLASDIKIESISRAQKG